MFAKVYPFEFGKVAKKKYCGDPKAPLQSSFNTATHALRKTM